MRIDDLLANRRVLTLREHPRQQRSIQRAAASGDLTAVLPGIFVRPEDFANSDVRVLAVAAWSRFGTICARSAVELWTQRPVSMPIRLRSPSRSAPVGWLQVTRGRLPAEHCRIRGPIRLASPAYAALEVAPQDGGRAVFDLLRAGLLIPGELSDVLGAFGSSEGNRERRRTAESAAANPWSFAEARLHDLLRSAGITGWQANRRLRVAGRVLRPDVWFPEEQLAIEVDGEAFHSSHQQFEHDRERQNLLASAGIVVLRFTWTMLDSDPVAVVRTIRQALETVSRSGHPMC